MNAPPPAQARPSGTVPATLRPPLRAIALVGLPAAFCAWATLLCPRLPEQTYPAVLVAVAAVGWWLGPGTAACALVLVAGALDWYAIDGEGLAVTSPGEASALAIMVILSSLAIWAVNRLRTTTGRAVAETADLERRLASRRDRHDELAHRIRNDLAALIATARLHDRVSGPEAALAATTDRLAIMGRLYGRLDLRGDGDAPVDMHALLRDVVTDLRDTRGAHRPIVMTVDAADVELPMATASVVALVVNEAIANACKYAWPDDAPGLLAVSLRRVGAEVVLEVADDGVGPDGGPPKGTGMGGRLLRAMTAQVSGRYALVREGDRTVARLSLPADRKPRRGT